ncbi:MAG: hypothetical protein HY858_03855 [Candidatus Solibacter usitatus]|nr:hypothetical protein [Candidatus Solibacter usitatus]
MKTRHLVVSFGLLAAFGGELAAQVVLNKLPTKVFGQKHLPVRLGEMFYPPSSSPNQTKQFSLYSPSSVAVDESTVPGAVFVADSLNHRVLGWRDSTGFVNGAPADLVVGQQNFTSAVPWGAPVRVPEPLPSGQTKSYDVQALKDFPSGLRYPSCVVFKGDYLFVVDAGNNRIVRFRRPFEQWDADGRVAADLVIGQPDLKSYTPNLGAGGTNLPTAVSIRTNATVSGVPQAAGIAFDREGNLWFSDAGNHRVLRYASSDVLGPSNVDGGSTVTANLVLGQDTFETAFANRGLYISTDYMNKSALRFGGPLAFDSAGNLFLADDLARVMMWRPPFDRNGKPADRILGVVALAKGQSPPPAANDLSFGFSWTGTSAQNAVYSGGPRGLFCVDENLFVVDTLNNRIVRFAAASGWPAEDLAAGIFSPHMEAVFGQADFFSRQPNSGETLEPSSNAYFFPTAAVYVNGEIFVSDGGNNRVLVQPFESASRSLLAATRVLGQTKFAYRSPNGLLGGEFSGGYVPGTLVPIGPSFAIDRSSDPPRLYIADTGNNRVLCFSDARRFDATSRADIIIGQVDQFRSLINSPFNDPKTAGPNGLYQPAEVAVDALGNLWVADTGNGRVLRYPSPFMRTDGEKTPDLVVGQPDFASRSTGAAERNRLYLPVGLAFTPEGNLAVSDIGHNRVLLFKQPSANGQTADLVLGQPDGSSFASGSGNTDLSAPRGVAIDSFGRLFVADTGNSRIQIWDDVNNTFSDGAGASFTLSSAAVGLPLAVTIDPKTESIWVADGGSLNRALRFPSYGQLVGSGAIASDFTIQVIGPRKIGLDGNGNPLVLDAAHRITMYYPQLTVLNAANGFPLPAPAMVGLLRVPGASLASSEASASGSPLPVELGDVEVIVNEMASPLLRVAGDSVRMIVPKATKANEPAEVLVRQVSTGQILAFSRIAMNAKSPGIWFQGDAMLVQGPARALNQDGSANSSSRPARIDQELTVFLTGHGSFDGLPDDGTAPGMEMPVPGDVTVYLLPATGSVPAQVLSSTLDPQEPGVWRVKIKVPATLPTGVFTVSVVYKSTSAIVLPGSLTPSVRPLVWITR